MLIQMAVQAPMAEGAAVITVHRDGGSESSPAAAGAVQIAAGAFAAERPRLSPKAIRNRGELSTK